MNFKLYATLSAMLLGTATAGAFLLPRYQDPEYRALLEGWGDGGQL